MAVVGLERMWSARWRARRGCGDLGEAVVGLERMRRAGKGCGWLGEAVVGQLSPV